MKRVTGIGGIFFKCKDPEKTREWYKKHLGFDMHDFGAMFKLANSEEGEDKRYVLWSPFKEDTTYFSPSAKDFMINYTVDDLHQLVEELKKEGVTFIDEIVEHEYGKFVHIMDNDGNNIELWEQS